MSRVRWGGTGPLLRRRGRRHPLSQVTDPIQQDERQEADREGREKETAHVRENMGKGRATPPAPLAQGPEDA
jgi:hypothetical protein